jgi:hypothetical protein
MTRLYHGPPESKLTTHLLETTGPALAGVLASGTNEVVPVYPAGGLSMVGNQLVAGPGFVNLLPNAQFLYAYANQYNPSAYQRARDCWNGTQSGGGVYTMAGASASAPAQYAAGSVVYLNYLTTTADAAIGAADFYDYRCGVEGFDCIPLQWGTAFAKAVTLSFWTYASTTGTYGGSLQNNASNRSYVFSYTIDVANTWEQKVINIPGDTTGTWLKEASTGIRLLFDLGSGTNYQSAAGAWAAGNYFGPTGGVQLISTLNRTWRLLLPQLQIGTFTTAPPFEFLPIGEIQKRNGRYVEAIQRIIVSNYTPAIGTRYHTVYWKYNKRAAPTITMGDLGNANYAAGVPTVNVNGSDITEVYKNSLGAGDGYYLFSILADASNG